MDLNHGRNAPRFFHCGGHASSFVVLPRLYLLSLSLSLSSFFPFPYLFFNLFLPRTADAHRLRQPLSTVDDAKTSVFYIGFCNVKVLNTRAHLVHRYTPLHQRRKLLPSSPSARIFIFPPVYFSRVTGSFRASSSSSFFLFFIDHPANNVEIHAMLDAKSPRYSVPPTTFNDVTKSLPRARCTINLHDARKSR